MNTSDYVVHVFPSHSFGGAEIYCLDLAFEQSRRGKKTAVWVAENSPMHKKAIEKGLNVITEPLSLRTDFQSIPRLVKFLKKHKITHLHFHWSGGAWAFLGVKLFTKVKMIYHIHMWILHGKLDPLHFLLYSQLDSVIVAGERAYQQTRKLLPIAKDKIHIVCYAQNFNTQIQSKRQELQYAANHYVFGLFARIDRQKGTIEFLEAAEKVIATHKNARFLIVGEPTKGEEDANRYEVEVEEKMKQINETQKSTPVIKLGFQSEFRSFLAAVDCLVAPSYHESYSLILLDAFALKKPVISTNSGGTPDIVSEDRGKLVMARSVDELVAAMKDAIENAQIWKNKGESAFAYVMKEHSYDSVIDKIEKIYQG